MDCVAIGERIRQKRMLTGLSQMKIAELSGLSHNYYSSLERGEYSGRLETYLKIAKTLDMSMDQMLADVYDLDSEPFLSAIMMELETLPGKQRNILLEVIQVIKKFC